jgi:hypothetical protein
MQHKNMQYTIHNTQEDIHVPKSCPEVGLDKSGCLHHKHMQYTNICNTKKYAIQEKYAIQKKVCNTQTYAIHKHMQYL